jgi:hypothetical protein
VEAGEQAGLGELLHIAPHRLQRHAELLGQRLDRQRPPCADFLDQQGLAGVGCHAAAASMGVFEREGSGTDRARNAGMRACAAFVCALKRKKKNRNENKTNTLVMKLAAARTQMQTRQTQARQPRTRRQIV